MQRIPADFDGTIESEVIMKTDLDAMAQTLREAGYIAFKPQPKPAQLRNAHLYDIDSVFAPTLVDYRRSDIVEATAKRILSRDMQAINSKANWRTLELAYLATRHMEGEIWEAGVYQGVTALALANCVREYGPGDSQLRLFDTYEGMPDTDAAKDLHSKGDFANTSLDAVKDLVGGGLQVSYHKGVIPATFAGLEHSRVRLVHIDLDIYHPILATLEFCYPRMDRGIFVFDDYGTPTCPGALEAVDKFFAGRTETVFTFATGQALAVKF